VSLRRSADACDLHTRIKWLARFRFRANGICVILDCAWRWLLQRGVEPAVRKCFILLSLLQNFFMKKSLLFLEEVLEPMLAA